MTIIHDGLTFPRTREDVVLPLSEPVHGRDGTMMSEVPIPKDTIVFIGIYTSNTRKALWGDDAHEWKPERWLLRLPDAVPDAKIPGVYSNLYVPFSRIPTVDTLNIHSPHAG